MNGPNQPIAKNGPVPHIDGFPVEPAPPKPWMNNGPPPNGEATKDQKIIWVVNELCKALESEIYLGDVKAAVLVNTIKNAKEAYPIDFQAFGKKMEAEAGSDPYAYKKAAIAYALAAGMWGVAIKPEDCWEDKHLLFITAEYCEAAALKLALTQKELDFVKTFGAVKE